VGANINEIKTTDLSGNGCTLIFVDGGVTLQGCVLGDGTHTGVGNNTFVLDGTGDVTDIRVSNLLGYALSGGYTGTVLRMACVGCEFLDIAASLGTVTALLLHGCAFLGSFNITGVAIAIRILECSFGGVTMNASSANSSIIIKDCIVAGNIAIAGSGILIEGTGALDILGNTVLLNLTNLHVVECFVRDINLLFQTGLRVDIWIHDNIITGRLFLQNPSTTALTHFRSNIHINENRFTAVGNVVSLVFVYNIEDVEIRGNHFANLSLNAAIDTIIRIQPFGGAATTAHAFAGIRVEDNWFDVATVDPHPVGNWGYALCTFETLNADPTNTYVGGNSFSGNHVRCRDPGFERMVVCLWVGQTRGFKCHDNILQYLGAGTSPWIFPVTGGPSFVYAMALLIALASLPAGADVFGNIGIIQTSTVMNNAVVNGTTYMAFSTGDAASLPARSLASGNVGGVTFDFTGGANQPLFSGTIWNI